MTTEGCYMVNTILGRKLGMTQVWTRINVVPVTVVLAGPCTVSQVRLLRRTANAAQIGFGDIS